MVTKETAAPAKEKFLILSMEGDCLQDLDTYRIQKQDLVTRRAAVETSYLSSKYKERTIINVVPVRVLLNKKVIEVMADVVTGTLYHKTGECLSSSNRRVIKWGK